jgi:hypothetical protein
MKSMMRLSAVGSVLTLAGALAFSGQAAADEVDATVNTLTGAGASYSLNSGINFTGTTAGIWNFTQNSGSLLTYDTNQFVSFCIDLADTIGVPSNHTWDVVGLAAAPDTTAGPMGATKANDLAKLLGGVITSGVLNDARLVLDTNTKRAAMQLAIWEVVHETSGTYSLSGGVAQFTASAAIINQANTYLALIGAAGTVAMRGLVGLTSTTTQDFVGQVPIPAAAWLFGSALLGVAALGRRRRKESEESETLA